MRDKDESFASFANRLKTFKNYQGRKTAGECSQAGFVYKEKELLTCQSCNVAIDIAEVTAVIMLAYHLSISPCCPFVLKCGMRDDVFEALLTVTLFNAVLVQLCVHSLD